MRIMLSWRKHDSSLTLRQVLKYQTYGMVIKIRHMVTQS